MLSNSILDISDDNQKAILKIIEKETEIPVFVKTASVTEEKKVYAIPEMKKFACDTPSDIWLSYQYLKKTASNLKPYVADVAMRNIMKYANWMGVNLNSREKNIELKEEYEIDKNDFALRIPKNELSEEFLSKNASYIYGNDLVLYPLNNKENIKKANMNFPKGLDGDLEGFRPMVATGISEKLPKDELSSQVKSYLPIPKSAAINQIEYRENKFPLWKDDYNRVKKMIQEENPNIIKAASELEKIDDKVGASVLYGDNFLSPLRYLQGIYDDTDYSYKKVKLASKEIFFRDLLSKKAELIDSIPETSDDDFKSPATFNQYYSQKPEYLKQAIGVILNG